MKIQKDKVNQDEVNKMVLDILEDIVGLSGVYCLDLAKKVENLNAYVYFGKTMDQISKEMK
jgi:hypothetical protein